MLDLSNFDQNSVGNRNNNIFGLPSTLDNADIVIINAPWEVTVSYGGGTARATEAIMKASLQVDLYDADFPNTFIRGYGYIVCSNLSRKRIRCRYTNLIST